MEPSDEDEGEGSAHDSGSGESGDDGWDDEEGDGGHEPSAELANIEQVRILRGELRREGAAGVAVSSICSRVGCGCFVHLQ